MSEAVSAFHIEPGGKTLKIVTHYVNQLKLKIERDKRPLPPPPMPLVDNSEIDAVAKAKKLALSASTNMRELIQAIAKHSAEGDTEMEAAMQGIEKAIEALGELGMQGNALGMTRELVAMQVEIDKVRQFKNWDELLMATVAHARDTADTLLELRNAIKTRTRMIGEGAVAVFRRNTAQLDSGSSMWKQRRSSILGFSTDITEAKTIIEKSSTRSAMQLRILHEYAKRAAALRVEEEKNQGRLWGMFSLSA